MKYKALLGAVVLVGAAVGSVQMLNTNESAERAYTPRETEQHIAQDAHGAAALFKQLRMDPATGEIPWDKAAQAKQQAIARAHSRNSLGLNFAPYGPDNIGGRTRAILVDPNNSNRVYCGSVSGGLFYSDNAGGNWTQHPDWTGVDTYAPFISTIAMAANGDIYVGTGCTFDDPWPGEGIYKSTDGGATFTQLSATVPSNTNSTGAEWAYVNRIACDPTNPNRIYVAMNQGMRVSDDGGQTFFNPLYADYPNCTFPLTSGAGNDVVVASNGRVYIAIQGRLYVSDTGNDCSYSRIDHPNLPGSAGRIALAIAPSDESYIWGIYTTGSGFLQGLYKSSDYGETWEVVAEPIPGYFEMFGDNGQGIYDLAIVVKPNDPETVIIGGVQLWRYDGNLTRIAGEFVPEFSFNYVHSDKHWFTYDPNDPNVLYIGSDGGIGKSLDGGETFFTANRGYQSTQNYGIALARNGAVLGGTQDNGTYVVFGEDPSTGNYSIDGTDVLSGDGFDCEVSTLLTASFATSQNGNLNRQKEEGDYSQICGQFCDNAPFHSRIRLWESDEDLTSKDSVDFVVDTLIQGVFVGNGTTKNFIGVVEPLQASAAFHSGSVKFRSGPDVLEIGPGPGVANVVAGPGSGTFDYATGAYDITFDVAPSSNLAVFVEYTNDFEAGDVVEVFSNTGNNEIIVEYTLPTALGPGESVRIQDPVQSLLAFVTNNGMSVTRGALNFSADPIWIDVTTVGGITSMEWSPDGNHLYFGSFNGAVYRLSGFNDVYDIGDEPNLEQVQLFNSGGGGGVTGISLSPNDPSQLVVTLGGYGTGNKVRLLTNIETATGTTNSVNISGDLPEMPVYDPEVLVNVDGNSFKCVIGTEFGVWVTEDYTATNVTWTNESEDLLGTPIYDIRQMKLGWREAVNHEVVVLGTYGRGLYYTNNFVSTEELEPLSPNTAEAAELRVYPNPMTYQGTLDFTLANSGLVQINVYDLAGKMVKALPARTMPAGNSQVQLGVSTLPTGTYIAVLTQGAERKTARFVVRK